MLDVALSDVALRKLNVSCCMLDLGHWTMGVGSDGRWMLDLGS